MRHQFLRGSYGGAAPPPASIQSKFVSWIEADNPTTDRASGAALAGTATVGAFSWGATANPTAAFTNGTITGASIPAMGAFSVCVLFYRTIAEVNTWMLSSGANRDLEVATYAGGFGKLACAGVINNYGSTSVGAADHHVLTREAGSADVLIYRDGAFSDTRSYSTVDIVGGSISSDLGANSLLGIVAVANTVLTPSEIAQLYNGGSFALWDQI